MSNYKEMQNGERIVIFALSQGLTSFKLRHDSFFFFFFFFLNESTGRAIALPLVFMLALTFRYHLL